MKTTVNRAVREELLRSIIRYIANSDRIVTSYEVSRRFGIAESTEATPKTRKLIKDAIREFSVGEGVVIGASNRGYFPLKTEGQVKRYRDALEGRIKGIEERISIVVNNWNEINGIKDYDNAKRN